MPDRRPSFKQKVLKTINRVRYRGPVEVLQLGLQRTSEWFSSEDELILMVRELTGADETTDPSFREATAADAARYARDIGTDSASTFRARLDDDVRCFVIELGDRFMHASWVTTTAAWTREIHGYMAPPPGSAYIYESFTRSDARGQGLYPQALAGIAAWLDDNGVAEAWVGVESHNQASIRAITKAGFTEGFRFRYGRSRGRLELLPPWGPRSAEAATVLPRALGGQGGYGSDEG